LIAFLRRKKVLSDVVDRARDPSAPGIPDLFLYRLDRAGRVHGGCFVEVKRWNRTTRVREQVSGQQKAELAFLQSVGLAAGVTYLIED
jgi:hypothetical protein